MKRELDYIEECLRKMGRQFNWGDISEWTNHNYDVLSDEIQKTTGIAISSRTLRRLANRRIKYNPQIATKNALAIYLGFQSWEDFLLSKNKNPSSIRQHSRINAFLFQYFWVLLFLVVIGLSSFFIFFYPAIEIELHKAKVVFYSNDMKGTAPHSASFFYDVSKIKSSNILIDNNYYKDGEIIPVKKNMHYYTNTFELPDYYAVKIIANGERISCVGVHVVTKGWSTIVNDNLYKSAEPVIDSVGLHLSEEQLSALGINPDSAIKVEYRNIKDFGVIGDDMVLETKFINNPSTGSSECQVSTIEIINTHGRLSFSFVTPDCDEKMLKAEFGDVYLAGEFNNLNTFFQDMNYWRNLRIVTGDRRVEVYLDDVQIYSIRYNEPLDDIKGIAFSFIGSGTVDYIKLYNHREDLVYYDDFNKHN